MFFFNPPAGRLKTLSNFAQGLIFVFLNHQWLGHFNPDPQGIHYAAMVGAVKSVAGEAAIELQQLRVWVDYASVPQANSTQQKVAINSLPSFSSCVDNFVVVALSTVHTSTGLTCDLASFHARCWCRAEIAGCWARNGTEDIYISTESGIVTDAGEKHFHLERLFPGGEDDPLLAEALDVFGGNLTCCRLGHPDATPCDREALVRPMLGLFHEIYLNRHGSRRDAWAALEPRISTLAPRSFDWKHTGVDGDITERAPLFGDLIDAAKLVVDTAQADDDEGNDLSKFSGFAPGTNSQRHILRPKKKVPGLLRVLSSVATPSFGGTDTPSPKTPWSSRLWARSPSNSTRDVTRDLESSA